VPISSTFYASIFVQKCFARLFSSYVLALEFLSPRFCTKNGRVKCWWHWRLVLRCLEFTFPWFKKAWSQSEHIKRSQSDHIKRLSMFTRVKNSYWKWQVIPRVSGVLIESLSNALIHFVRWISLVQFDPLVNLTNILRTTFTSNK